jgi:hypothetical protein
MLLEKVDGQSLLNGKYFIQILNLNIERKFLYKYRNNGYTP